MTSVVLDRPRSRLRTPSLAGVAQHESLLAFLLIGAVSWVAQFHHFRDLGLYEDDYWFISEAMGKDPSYLVARFEKVFSTLPQGRPFGFFLPDLLSWIGDRLGGLPAIYVVGFLVVVFNSFLCYRLLRLRAPALVAGAGSLAFLLFPADTTHFLLIHDFQLQPSLTFILLASLAYARGWLPLAYLLSVGALMAYENGFLAFFALPLLLRPWNRTTMRELARHILVLLGLLVLVVALRFAVGEGRATSSVGSVAEIAPRVVGSLIIGPARALAAFVYGPVREVRNWDAETILLSVASGIALGYLARWLLAASSLSRADGRSVAAPHASSPTGSSGGVPLQPEKSHAAIERHHERIQADAQPGVFGNEAAAALTPGLPGSSTRSILEFGAAGVIMLVLGYLLAFTHYPPNALVGRGTSVHLGATLGAAILFATAVWLGTRLLSPQVLAPALAGYAMLAIGYQITIERDFMRSWQIQREFWQQVSACCSDLQDGTVLIYELPPNNPETTFISTNSWADALVLDETYRFPSSWTTPPRLFSLTQWQNRVEAEGDHLRWLVPAATWDEHYETFPEANVILLRNEDGRVTRYAGTLDLAGETFTLKPPASSTNLPPAQLHDLLLQPR